MNLYIKDDELKEGEKLRRRRKEDDECRKERKNKLN